MANWRYAPQFEKRKYSDSHENQRSGSIIETRLLKWRLKTKIFFAFSGWEPGNFSETYPYWLSQGNSTHAETLNVTNKREIGINPELKSTGYSEIQMISEHFHPTRNDSSKTTVSHDWNSSTKATNESLRKSDKGKQKNQLTYVCNMQIIWHHDLKLLGGKISNMYRYYKVKLERSFIQEVEHNSTS